MGNITENFATVQTFFESLCEKKISWMDGWINFTKEEKKNVLVECSVSTQKQPLSVRYMYLNAADVRYHLDCWLVQA